jgi:hypothetical protein
VAIGGSYSDSFHDFSTKGVQLMISTSTLILIILLLLLVGAIPAWPHSKDWGYFPSGGLGVVLVVLLVLILMGRI